MEYRTPYTYVFDKPGGTQTVLLTGVALGSTLLVPVVGQIVVMGYSAEVTEDIERDPAVRDHDNFDFQFFVRYLTRGVWPFLATVLVQVVLSMFVFAAMAASFGVGYATNNQWAGMGVYVALALPLSVLGMMMSLPFLLHVQLTGKLRVMAATAFAARFLGKVWGQCLVTLTVHFLISTVVTTLGMLLCCVGFFPAATVVMFATDHFAVQLYRLYLAEGGVPIGGREELAEFDRDDG